MHSRVKVRMSRDTFPMAGMATQRLLRLGFNRLTSLPKLRITAPNLIAKTGRSFGKIAETMNDRTQGSLPPAYSADL